MQRFLVCLILSLLLTATADGASRPANFGQQWVRSHDLTLMGLQQWPHTNNVSLHQQANMTSMLVWWADGNGKQIAAASSAAGMPWHALIVDGEGPEQARIPDYASVGNARGWMLGDEISRAGMQWYGDLGEWTKTNRPNDLVYTNAFPTY